MVRMTVLIAISGILATASPSISQNVAEARPIARLMAAFNYYTKKPDLDKAQQNLQAVYLLLMSSEASEGKAYADRLFYLATGITTDRVAYFKSLGILDREGRLVERQREPDKKSFTCTRHWSGEVNCHEN